MRKPRKQHSNKRTYIAIFPVLFFIFYLILDYLNIPQYFGLSISRINMDIFNIFLNSVVVIVLYIFTYYLVDRKQIQKDINAKNTADILLLYTYKACLANISMVMNTAWTTAYIIPKVNGNKPIAENKIITDLQDFPFTSKTEILELSKGGYIEKTVLDTYFHIQYEYRDLVAMKITFYDLAVPETPDQKALYKDINHRSNELLSLLKNEIERLEVVS